MVLIDEGLLALLNQHWDAVREAGVPAASHRLPGSQPEEVVAVLEEEGLRADPQVVTVLSWSGGTALAGIDATHRQLNPVGAVLIGLEEARSAYHTLVLEPWDQEFAGWWPVLEVGRGHALIDCGVSSPTAGQLRTLIMGEPSAPFDGLATVLTWWTDRLRDGRYAWQPSPPNKWDGWVVRAGDAGTSIGVQAGVLTIG